MMRDVVHAKAVPYTQYGPNGMGAAFTRAYRCVLMCGHEEFRVRGSAPTRLKCRACAAGEAPIEPDVARGDGAS